MNRLPLGGGGMFVGTGNYIVWYLHGICGMEVEVERVSQWYDRPWISTPIPVPYFTGPYEGGYL